ncbi:hypothetical protein PVAND_001662 [Polypedilum vanderplanki]|uniref:Uncharacterized protein n=1 Tax=Polypedilum vanderplanki TaxID=319348 RepID=A0A9J6BPX8_POLVA|nr:hypothetical protein PVAND_001662 [Polypedilum vanderplanki]
MGSNQSRNNFIPQSNIKIIITNADDEADFIENEDNDEFFECLTDLNFVPYNDNDDGGGSKSNRNENEIEKNCENKILQTTHNEKKFSIENADADVSNGIEEDDESSEERKERLRRELDTFRKDLLEKRSLCQHSISKWRVELTELREKYNKEVLLNEQLREMMEERGITALESQNRSLKLELAECQMFLQTSNSENINVSMENKALRDHIRSLKEVIKATKEMLEIRECQVNQLKSKLTEIEVSFSEKETKIMSTELQKEYQRQLDNIRNMRELYEERANLMTQERDKLKVQLEEKEQDIKIEIEKSQKLQEQINIMEDNIKLKNTDISMLENEISQMKFEKEKVLSEMNALNQLLAQVLIDFNASGNKIDLENLYKMLEQNRALLNEMTSKEDYAVGLDDEKLPKLLYELFLQVNKSNTENDNEEIDDDSNKKDRVSTPTEIASKLPKVWRVINEFLNHDKLLMDEEEAKTDDTQAAATALSVSKTFIKLRDLILQKRSLQRDTGRLKTLYSHLESRLDKQEKRLSSVSLELTKTWHTVGKIKRQNRQLHTHEQILCYQLQQKRRLLNELKAELEYCRKKWALARAINNESEEQLGQMRHEFAQRKIQDKNSAESGYSDDHVSDAESDEFCKSDKDRIERFNKNLLTFDKIETTVCEEPVMYQFRKWRSESTLLQNFSNLPLIRAQSEPPQHIYDPDENKDMTFDLDNYVILIPNACVFKDSVQSRIVATDDEDISQQQSLVINLPPKIHDTKKKKELSKSKKNKKSKKYQNKSETETAEAMFMRLLTSMNNEESQATSTTSSMEEEEEIEIIPDIPIDDVKEEDISIETKEEMITEDQPSTSNNNVTEAGTSTEDDYLKRREIRLSRLEAEAKEFYEKMSRNKEKRLQLNNHLDSVHQNFLDRQKEKEKDKGKGDTSSSDSKTKKDDSDKSDDNEN